MTDRFVLATVGDPETQRALDDLLRYLNSLAATGSGATGAAGGVLGGTYPNPTFAADMATQVELDAHAALTGTAHILPAVTALPGTPVTGQRCVLQTAGMAALTIPVAWELWYDGTKWIPIGSSVPLFHSVSSFNAGTAGVDETIPAGVAYAGLTTAGPTHTIPVTGTYLLEHEFYAYNSVANTPVIMSFKINATAAADADGAFTQSSGANSGIPFGRRSQTKSLTAGDVLLAQYRTTAGTANIRGPRTMKVTPLRLG